LQIGEMLGLKWRNVNFERNEIHVRRVKENDATICEVTKTAAPPSAEGDPGADSYYCCPDVIDFCRTKRPRSHPRRRPPNGRSRSTLVPRRNMPAAAIPYRELAPRLS